MSRKVAALAELHRRMVIRQYSNYCCGKSMGVQLPSHHTTTTSMQYQNFNPTIYFVEKRNWDNKYFENYVNYKATTNRYMSCYSPTKMMFDKIIVKVPTMGDSITEVCILIFGLHCEKKMYLTLNDLFGNVFLSYNPFFKF